MDYNTILNLFTPMFPNLKTKIDEAQGMIKGVENSFDGVKNFLKSSNITNEQIDKVANFIQTHPMGKMLGGHPLLVANQIRELKNGDMNKDRSVAPEMKLPVNSVRRTTKI